MKTEKPKINIYNSTHIVHLKCCFNIYRHGSGLGTERCELGGTWGKLRDGVQHASFVVWTS